jgi:hypothetical protein
VTIAGIILTYETTEAETSIEDRVGDIRQDDILSSSSQMSNVLKAWSYNLPCTKTTNGREHTNRAEGHETQDSDLS